MRLNRQLNLTLPLNTELSGVVHVHSNAISTDVFHTYYLELSKVFTQCFDSSNEVHFMLSAPQVAYVALKSISTKAGTWEGTSGVKFGLVNEIVRMTNLVVSTEKGWVTVPFHGAVKQHILTEDEENEVLSVLVFFTAISKVAPKELKVSFLEMVGKLRDWVITSSDCTEFQNFLQTSIQPEISGATVIA